MKKVALLLFVFAILTWFKTGVVLAVDCLTTEIEPNGTISQADANPPLCESTTFNGALDVNSAGLEPGDGNRYDYFKINVSVSGPVTIDLTKIPVGSDYDLYIRNFDNTILGTSDGTTSSSEHISLDLNQGKYFILVYNLSGGSSQPYSLVWHGAPSVPTPTPTPTPTCQPRPGCLDSEPQCLIQEPLEGWCPTPTCQPRPGCLDSEPRCMLPEPLEGWCPPVPTPPTGSLIWSNVIELVVTNNTERPPYCDSISMTGTQLTPTENSLTITSNSKINVSKFSYLFLNMDNQKSASESTPISFEQVDGKNANYFPSIEKKGPAVTSNSITVNFVDLDRVDLNTGQKPVHIQVNAYFSDPQGKLSAATEKCVVRFPVRQTSTSSYQLKLSESAVSIPVSGSSEGYAIYAILTDADGKAVADQTNFEYFWNIDDASIASIAPFIGCTNGINSPCPEDHLGISGLKVGTTQIHVTVAQIEPQVVVATGTFDLTVVPRATTTSVLTMIVKFAGINTDVGPIPTKVSVGRPDEPIYSQTVNFNFSENGYYKAAIDVPILDSGPRDVFIKGPSHMQRKFTSVPFVVGQNNVLDTKVAPYNKVLPAGDVVKSIPDPSKPGATTAVDGQDGVLTMDDISAVVSVMSRAQKFVVPVTCGLRIDVTRDCKISLDDVSLVVNTMSTFARLVVPDEN